MFCLLVVLVKLSVLVNWLARKTPLRKPNHGEGSSPESPGRRVRMIFLVYCIASLFYYVFMLSPAPTQYIILMLWRDITNLFVLNLPHKPQADKQYWYIAVQNFYSVNLKSGLEAAVLNSFLHFYLHVCVLSVFVSFLWFIVHFWLLFLSAVLLSCSTCLVNKRMYFGQITTRNYFDARWKLQRHMLGLKIVLINSSSSSSSSSSEFI